MVEADISRLMRIKVEYEPPRPPPFWPFFLAVMVMLAVIVLIFCNLAHAQEYSDARLVNAIYLAEGGAKAQYAYGIRSIPYRDLQDARRICLNSVRNGRKRWIKAGKPGDLISYIGLRYSPPKNNPNWVRLVIYFYKKG